MNLFNYDVNRKCLIAEGWCPTNDIPLVQQSLKEATVSIGVDVKRDGPRLTFCIGCLWH